MVRRSDVTVTEASESAKRNYDIIRAIAEYDRGTQSDRLTLPAKQRKTLQKKNSRSEISGTTTPPRHKWFESMKDLEKGVEAKVKQARDRENEWKSQGKPVTMQIANKEWIRLQHEDNTFQQRRRTKMTTIKQNDDGKMEVTSREEFEVDLATAEVCEEKLQAIQLNHHIDYAETATELLEKSEKDVQEYKEKQGITDQQIQNDTLTDPQKADIKAIRDRYKAEIEDARKKCDKAVREVNTLYTNRRLDTSTLVDLEWIEAKQVNDTDYKRRIKSVESKIAQLPEELETNAKSIQEKLSKIETDLGKIDGNASIHKKVPGEGADERTTTEIMNELKTSLGKDNIAGVHNSIAELNRRIQHYSSRNELKDHPGLMKNLHQTLVDTSNIFKKREIKLEEQQALIAKNERYIRSQDAESMLYNEQLLELKRGKPAARGKLAKAENEAGYLTLEVERLYRDSRMHTIARPAIISRIGDEDISTGYSEGSRHHEVPTTGGADPQQEALGAENRQSYEDARQALERARGTVLSLKEELGQLVEREIILQKKVDLAKGRHDTNEKREELKRGAIYELDKQVVENRRKTHQETALHQRKLDILEINVQLLKIHSRRMMVAAATAAFMPMAPNTMQRDMQNQWNSFQSLIRNW